MSRWRRSSLASVAVACLGLTLALGAGGAERSVPAADRSEATTAKPETSAVTIPRPLGAYGTGVGVGAGQVGQTVYPGAPPVDVFYLGFLNYGVQPETLKTLAFENRTTGPGTQAQLDADWQSLILSAVPVVAENGSTIKIPIGSATSFSNGVARFNNLRLPILPGDTTFLAVSGGASLTARDGDVLDLRVANHGSMTFARTVTVYGDFPLDPAGSFPVDGMTAAQVALDSLPEGGLPVGTQRNLVFSMVVPANGYQADLLHRIDVANRGSALPGVDIAAMEAWLDNGDRSFGPQLDARLGALAFTGDRWQLTGLSLGVPSSGRRVFVTVDIAEQAVAGRTVNLALPSTPDVALGMMSNNDGPIDRQVSYAVARPITTVDRITLATGKIDPGSVHPGAADVLLLDLVATNTYSVEKTLTSVVVDNATSGSGTQAQRDAEIEVVTLREDKDDNGVLDPEDPVLGTAFFNGGRAQFSGLAWSLPPEKTRHLFVTGVVALAPATDGGVLSTALTGTASLGFSDATAVSAAWPLGDAQWTVDGMVAGQLTNFGAPGIMLAPGEGPVEALDLVVPRNGYQGDQLTSLEVANFGTAAPSEIADVHLWRDGGDGVFGAGAGDDVDLGAMTPIATGWTSTALGMPLGVGGARLFVSVQAAATVTDGAAVRLAVPQNGIQVASGNDGPVDQPVVNAAAITLSTRALLTALRIEPATATVGQNVTVRMTVRNVGAVGADAVTPSALSVLGGLAYVGGPLPATADLPSSGTQDYLWTFSAGVAGDARVSGSASGVESGSGVPLQSLDAESNLLRIFEQADSLPLAAYDVMPQTVNRGQTGVIPLYLSFTHPGGDDAPDVHVLGLRVRLENESGGGIVPADLLTRVVVTDGAAVYLDRTGLETTGSQIDLTLATPILVARGQQVTVALLCDISASTVVPNVRVTIPDGSWFDVADAAGGAPVTVTLAPLAFPIRTSLARVVAQATQLDVAAIAAPTVRASPAQLDVPLLDARLSSPGITGLTSDVRVAALEVVLMDSAGSAVPDPWTVLARLRLRGPFSQLYADRPVVPGDTALALTLSPLLIVPVNTPLDVLVQADLAAGAPLGRFRLRLADSTRFDARDASSGNPVAVVYAAPSIEGPDLLVETRAETLRAAGIALLPDSLPVGTAGVPALTALFRHPGGPGVGRIRIDSLTVRCWDDARDPLVPSAYVDRLRVLWNDTLAAAVPDPPSTGSAIRVALGRTLEAGDTARVTFVLDFEVAAPAGTFELSLNDAGVAAADANGGTAVAIEPEIDTELPLLSGLVRLQPPARTLVVGFESLMPAVLAPDGGEIPVARITLVNGAAAGSGTVTVDRLRIRGAGQSLDSLAAGAAFARIAAYRDGLLWAESAPLSPDSATAWLPAATALALQPAVPVVLELRANTRLDPSASEMRLGIRGADVGVIQPENPLLGVVVQPQPGRSFPMWSEVGRFGASTLAGSWSNFPNPFAAGRQRTSFAYFLPQSGRVSLRIWTPRGERVASLLESTPRARGLYQNDTWDGRNGRGAVVANGVYVAELVVQLDGGPTERLLRKVAVVR
jgi:hypothetical protein